jgi:hypothetical protein
MPDVNEIDRISIKLIEYLEIATDYLYATSGRPVSCDAIGFSARNSILA